MLLLLHKTLKGSQNIQGFALIRAVLFSFITTRAVHFDINPLGAPQYCWTWERMFVCCKWSIYSIIEGFFKLTDRDLVQVLFQWKVSPSSRLITPMSSDSTNLQKLTINPFSLGKTAEIEIYHYKKRCIRSQLYANAT